MSMNAKQAADVVTDLFKQAGDAIKQLDPLAVTGSNYYSLVALYIGTVVTVMTHPDAEYTGNVH